MLIITIIIITIIMMINNIDTKKGGERTDANVKCRRRKCRRSYEEVE